MTDYVPGTYGTDTYEHRDLVPLPNVLRCEQHPSLETTGEVCKIYVSGVSRTGRGRTITGTKRKCYSDGETRTGHSMLTHILL